MQGYFPQNPLKIPVLIPDSRELAGRAVRSRLQPPPYFYPGCSSHRQVKNPKQLSGIPDCLDFPDFLSNLVLFRYFARQPT